MARLDRLHETVTEPLWGVERQYTDGMISADELYTATRAIIEKVAEDEAVTSEAKQFISHISHKLLNHLLQDDNASPEAVGYYTDMLISIKSPNADMIFEALQVLDGYWTEEHIRTTADEAIRNAEEWLSHTDEGVRYAEKDRPAIITSVRASSVHRFSLNTLVIRNGSARLSRKMDRAVPLRAGRLAWSGVTRSLALDTH